MELLILFLILVIIILACLCYSMFDSNRKTFKKLFEMTINYNSAISERDAFEKESQILEKEVNTLKEFEKKVNQKDYVLCNNKKIKIKNTFKGKKLLLGDYNIEMLKHSRNVFLSLGFDVDIVHSGDDLIQKVMCGYHYDVIVTNNMYKNSCDGTDVLRELREIPYFETPIIVLTVSTGEKDRFINELGFDGYLEKMVTQKQAEEVITAVLLNKKSN